MPFTVNTRPFTGVAVNRIPEFIQELRGFADRSLATGAPKLRHTSGQLKMARRYGLPSKPGSSDSVLISSSNNVFLMRVDSRTRKAEFFALGSIDANAKLTSYAELKAEEKAKTQNDFAGCMTAFSVGPIRITIR